jgi:hypothetical protein
MAARTDFQGVTMMRPTLAMSLLALLTALPACGPSHDHRRYRLAGQPLHVAVHVSKDKDASGTVRYRLPDVSAYTDKPLERAGGDLWTSIPVHSVDPNQTIRYYFDVTVDGEPHQLGSPTDPYLVTVLARADYIPHAFSASVRAADEEHAVEFQLELEDRSIELDKVILQYRAPQMFGRAAVDMREHDGKWYYEIPARYVAPGFWEYRIAVEADGRVYYAPHESYASFTVHERP